jgi:hypothetical protein
MFALLALLCFVIAQFETALGPVDLLLAGLALVAAHLLMPDPIGTVRARRS